MQESQQINWWLEVAKIGVPSLVALIIPFIASYWLSLRMEDYKKEVNKEIENHKIQLQSDFYKLQASLQEERERKRLFLKKLEEIHEQISNYKKYFNGLEINMLQFLAADKDIKKTTPVELKEFQFYKLQLLIGIYASDLIGYVDKLEELSELCRGDAGMYFLEEIEIKSKERFARFLSTKNEILKVCNEIEKRIVEISKQYI